MNKLSFKVVKVRGDHDEVIALASNLLVCRAAYQKALFMYPTDPGCVKTLRGIAAPRILRLVVTLRAQKRKNSSFARHYDQIRFRFHTGWTQSRLPAAFVLLLSNNIQK